MKQHSKTGLTSGTRGKRKMNLQKVLENLPPNLLTAFHLVFLLFKNFPLPCYHRRPVGTRNYQELTGVNGAGKEGESADNHALEFPNYSSLCYVLTTIQEIIIVIRFLIMFYQSRVVLCTDNIHTRKQRKMSHSR